eukprot:s2538_g37.t1
MEPEESSADKRFNEFCGDFFIAPGSPGRPGRSEDVRSVNSADIRMPLPLGLDDEMDEALPIQDEFDDSCMEADDELSAPVHEEPLSEVDRSNLFTVIDNECLANQPALSVSLPWELDSMRMIFDDDERSVSLPTPVLEPSLPLSPAALEGQVIKQVQTSIKARGSFQDIIDFKLNFSDQ